MNNLLTPVIICEVKTKSVLYILDYVIVTNYLSLN